MDFGKEDENRQQLSCTSLTLEEETHKIFLTPCMRFLLLLVPSDICEKILHF